LDLRHDFGLVERLPRDDQLHTGLKIAEDVVAETAARKERSESAFGLVELCVHAVGEQLRRVLPKKMEIAIRADREHRSLRFEHRRSGSVSIWAEVIGAPCADLAGIEWNPRRKGDALWAYVDRRSNEWSLGNCRQYSAGQQFEGRV